MGKIKKEIKKDLNKLGIKTYKHKVTQALYVKRADVKNVLAHLSEAKEHNLAEDVLDKARGLMMEDNIPDDDQPDLVPKYIEMAMEDVSNGDLVKWFLGSDLAREYAESRMPKPSDDLNEWLSELFLDYVDNV